MESASEPVSPTAVVYGPGRNYREAGVLIHDGQVDKKRLEAILAKLQEAHTAKGGMSASASASASGSASAAKGGKRKRKSLPSSMSPTTVMAAPEEEPLKPEQEPLIMVTAVLESSEYS